MPQQEENKSIIRSNEVNEILSQQPNWLLRWGISIIAMIIVGFLLLSFFIKYSEVVLGEGGITTRVQPVKLRSKISGRIVSLDKKDGDFVNEGDVIATIENPISEKGIEYLKKTVSKIKLHISQKLSADFTFFDLDSAFVFGDIQTEYNNLKNNYKDLSTLENDGFFDVQTTNLYKQITLYQELTKIEANQINLANKELVNIEEQYNTHKNLYAKNVISKVEFYKEESNYIQFLQNLENMKKGHIQNKITLASYEKQLKDTQQEYKEKIRTLKEKINNSIANIENNINNWQQNYLLISPYNGQLSYLALWTEKQFVDANQELFTVVPSSNNYIANMLISTQNAGKVHVGQSCFIQLDNFPMHEFGQLKGTVANIAAIPTQQQINDQKVFTYQVIVVLESLQTTYNKTIDFTPEMRGTIKIVTKEMSLFDRIMNQFRKLMDGV